MGGGARHDLFFLVSRPLLRSFLSRFEAHRRTNHRISCQVRLKGSGKKRMPPPHSLPFASRTPAHQPPYVIILPTSAQLGSHVQSTGTGGIHSEAAEKRKGKGRELDNKKKPLITLRNMSYVQGWGWPFPSSSLGSCWFISDSSYLGGRGPLSFLLRYCRSQRSYEKMGFLSFSSFFLSFLFPFFSSAARWAFGNGA